MNTKGISWFERGLPLAVVTLAAVLWMRHAEAWSLGRRSPVLGFDAAQYAVAARELAHHGRFATPFALPIELARDPSPPWPLAVVQPGLVVIEAVIERVVPGRLTLGPLDLDLREPGLRERLMLVTPLTCFFAIGALLTALSLRLLRDHAPALSGWERCSIALLVGALFTLDPEAQHLAAGGLTELPFTLGLLLAVAALAFDWAPRRPLLYGVLLGLTGTLRGNMLWLAPVFVAGAAAGRPREDRIRTALLALAGFAIPLTPWWLYKAWHFGNPGWDLSALGLWDGVQDRTWFSLTHLPRFPDVPPAGEALPAIAQKLGRNLAALIPALFAGMRGPFIAALAVWVMIARPRPALRTAALALMVSAVLGLLVASLGASWLRYLFPARVPLEAAGLLALLALLGRVPRTVLRDGPRRIAGALVAVAALAWGFQQTARGNAEARQASASRGLPGVASLRALAERVDRDVPAGEPVMSNLGPTLAWYTQRPVIHLSLRPENLRECRARTPFRHVVLAFQDSAHAWSGWDRIVARPEIARLTSEWDVHSVRDWTTAEGIRVVWLELAPSPPPVARSSPAPRRS